MINNVLIYGFDTNNRNLIKSIFKEEEFCIIETDCTTDLIALPACAIIISCNDFSEEDYSELIAAYKDIDVFSELVIFVGTVNYDLNKKFFNYSDMDKFLEKGKYLVMTAKRRERKRHTFSSAISMAIRILSEIQNNPGVTTKCMAEKFEVNSRTVQRYIETLNMAGEAIIKEKHTGGWRLEYDKSLLILTESTEE